MHPKEIVWEEDPARFSNGLIGKVGGMPFFTVCYDSCISKSDPNPNRYRLRIRLEGIAIKKPLYSTIEEAQAAATNLLTYIWSKITELS